MRNEIVQNTIKSAFGMRLAQVFPGITWYQESIVNLRFPHFFVFQLTIDSQKDNYNHWWINYFINLRYRVASDTANVTNLNQQLDSIALTLLTELDYIEFLGDKFRVENIRCEKVDGVLHCFCNVTVRAAKPFDEVVKQLEISQSISLRSD